MKNYGLFTKTQKEMISTTKSSSLEDAIHFFSERKKMAFEDFDKIFSVEEITSKRKQKTNFHSGGSESKYFSKSQ